MSKNIVPILVWLVLVAAIIAVACTGCATTHPTTQPVHEFVAPGHTPASLVPVSHTLDWFIALSVLAVGAGIGLFFWLPAAHNISFGLMFIGGGIEASALVTRASLWAVPWVALAFVVAGLAFLAYEIVRNFPKIEAEVGTLIHDADGNVAGVLPKT